MAWEISSFTLDGDKVSQKVGNIVLFWQNAYLTETYTTEAFRFPIITGTAGQQLNALKTKINADMATWVARRTAEDSFKTAILNGLNT